jgi:hypothetical protein
VRLKPPYELKFDTLGTGWCYDGIVGLRLEKSYKSLSVITYTMSLFDKFLPSFDLDLEVGPRAPCRIEIKLLLEFTLPW